MSVIPHYNYRPCDTLTAQTSSIDRISGPLADICLRLLEGADIYQVAKNRRTSVEMIEKFYGRHPKNNIDASAVNVRKAGPRPITRKGAEAWFDGQPHGWPDGLV